MHNRRRQRRRERSPAHTARQRAKMARLLAGLLSLACLPSPAPASDQVVDLQHHDELLDALREYDVVALRYWMNHCPHSKYSEPEVRALRPAAPLPRLPDTSAPCCSSTRRRTC